MSTFVSSITIMKRGAILVSIIGTMITKTTVPADRRMRS